MPTASEKTHEELVREVERLRGRCAALERELVCAGQERLASPGMDALRLMADACDHVLWVRDAGACGYAYISPAYESLFGRRRERLLANPEEWANAVHPDDRDLIERRELRLLQGEGGQDLYRIVRPDRTVRWVNERVFVIRDRHGRMMNMAGIAGDVTDWKETENALRASEQRMRAILSAVPDLMFRFSRDGTYLDYHAPNERLLFVSPRDFIGKRLDAVLPPAAAARGMHHIRECLRTRELQVFQYTLPLPDRVRVFDARMAPSGFDEVVAIVRDVSSLVDMAGDTGEGWQSHKRILESSPAIVYVRDVHAGRNLYANRHLKAELGYIADSGDPMGTEAFNDLVHPEDRSKLMAHESQMAEATDESVLESEVRLRHRDGTWRRAIRREVVMERDASGRVRKILGNVTVEPG